MKKDSHNFCYFVNNYNLIPVILHENQLIEAVKTFTIQNKDGRRNSKSVKVLLSITKDLTFSITNVEICQNRKFKFTLKLKFKDTFSHIIIIDGKEELEFFIKNLSQSGIGTGLQQIVTSCEKIGQGSFAQVYKAITNYDSIMALKAFSKSNLKSYKNKLAFQNQIDVMRSLNSKHIASVEGLFETQKNIYLKMEYFQSSLKYYFKKNISINTQKKIIRQILQALIQMKSKNIIHRDLKPDNIMIRGKNQNQMECVIIDFGLATPANIDKYIFNRCGTPGFLAPQIAKMSTKKQKLTPACDMFSLGCIFYRMLTKKYIFAAQNYDQVIEKNKGVDIPWQSFNQFSDNQRDLLSKMLQKDPAKRIIPQQAINHPYFCSEVDDDDDIPFEACDITRKMKTITMVSCRSRKLSMELIMQSFHSSSNPDIFQNDSYTNYALYHGCGIKDSYLSFDGPVKENDQGSKNADFDIIPETTFRLSRLNKRTSRFSQIKNILL